MVESVERKLTTIILENPKTYSDFIMELNECILGNESNIGIFEDSGESIRHTRCAMVWNPYLIQMNTKPILGKIYKEMEQIATEEFWNDMQDVHMKIVRYLDGILMKLPYPLEYSLDMKPDDVFRLYKVLFSENYESVLEKLCDYVKIVSRVCGLKCLFLLNLHDFLCMDEINELIKIANYHEMQLICIESHQRRSHKDEHTYLLDESDCVIRF